MPLMSRAELQRLWGTSTTTDVEESKRVYEDEEPGNRLLISSKAQIFFYRIR